MGAGGWQVSVMGVGLRTASDTHVVTLVTEVATLAGTDTGWRTPWLQNHACARHSVALSRLLKQKQEPRLQNCNYNQLATLNVFSLSLFYTRNYSKFFFFYPTEFYKHP